MLHSWCYSKQIILHSSQIVGENTFCLLAGSHCGTKSDSQWAALVFNTMKERNSKNIWFLWIYSLKKNILLGHNCFQCRSPDQWYPEAVQHYSPPLKNLRSKVKAAFVSSPVVASAGTDISQTLMTSTIRSRAPLLPICGYGSLILDKEARGEECYHK